MIRKLITVALATIATFATLTGGTAGAGQVTAEEAFVATMAEILGGEVDPAGSLAGGHNACFWIAEYGLDPVTLDGWENYWHEPWEEEWLRAAVTWLCPPGQ